MRSGQAVGATDEDYFDFVDGMTQVPGHDVADLSPRLARLRAQAPVHEGKMWELLGLGTAPNRTRSEAARDFAVVGFDAATQLLRDGTQVSSRIWQKTAEITWGYSIVVMDDPDHRRHRALIEQAFTRHAMETLERDLIAPIVEQVVDGFVARGRADLVREFTFRFPILIIAKLLGLPDADIKQYHVWGSEVILFDQWDRAVRASQAMGNYLLPIIEDRRTAPRDDMISALAGVELDGDRLSNDAIIAFLRNLVTAGAETTYSSTGSLLFGLLTNPDQLDALRKDRSLMSQAIEEGIRWQPPLTNVRRALTRDVEIAGVHMPAGSFIYVSLASANRDDSRWDHPEDFDIHRDRHAHLAFGFSTHMCLGMHLARAETATALNALLDRLPNLRLDPDAPAPAITGVSFRRPKTLPVVWG
ncbi:MAG: cytochrome P450 [Actinomycetota bacterium]